MATVPAVAEMHLAHAFDAMREEGLQPVLIGLPTTKTTGNTGYVVATHEPPTGATVVPGARVALAAATRILSWGSIEGPPIAIPGTLVPDVVGVEIEQAMARVTNQGFIAVVFQPKRCVEQLSVTRQDPQPGQPVERFREVALWLDQLGGSAVIPELSPR